jgi:hypothetical protein
MESVIFVHHFQQEVIDILYVSLRNMLETLHLHKQAASSSKVMALSLMASSNGQHLKIR